MTSEQDRWLTTSGVGYNTGEPFVTITTPEGRAYQMRADDARALGLALLEAANAAEFDHAFLTVAVVRGKQTLEAAGVMLEAIREQRAQPIVARPLSELRPE